MIYEISRCEDCPKYTRIDEGMGGSYDACMAMSSSSYGTKVDSYLAWKTRPDWCPFKLGDKIEFVFVGARK